MNLILKTILVVVIFAILFVTWQYARTRHFIRIGEGLAAEANAYSQVPEKADLKFLTIGDSSAVGVGASSSAISVAGLLGKDYPNASIKNLGVNGARVADLPSRLQAEAGNRYDLVLIHIGGNDVVRRTDIGDIERDMRKVIDLAKKLTNQVVILHGGDIGEAYLLPLGSRWWFGRRTHQVRDLYIKLAEEKDVKYADILREKGFRGDDFHQFPQKTFAEDKFHPSDFAYAYWYEQVRKQISF